MARHLDGEQWAVAVHGHDGDARRHGCCAEWGVCPSMRQEGCGRYGLSDLLHMTLLLKLELRQPSRCIFGRVLRQARSAFWLMRLVHVCLVCLVVVIRRKQYLVPDAIIGADGRGQKLQLSQRALERHSQSNASRRGTHIVADPATSGSHRYTRCSREGKTRLMFRLCTSISVLLVGSPPTAILPAFPVGHVALLLQGLNTVRSAASCKGKPCTLVETRATSPPFTDTLSHTDGEKDVYDDQSPI